MYWLSAWIGMVGLCLWVKSVYMYCLVQRNGIGTLQLIMVGETVWFRSFENHISTLQPHFYGLTWLHQERAVGGGWCILMRKCKRILCNDTIFEARILEFSFFEFLKYSKIILWRYPPLLFSSICQDFREGVKQHEVNYHCKYKLPRCHQHFARSSDLLWAQESCTTLLICVVCYQILSINVFENNICRISEIMLLRGGCCTNVQWRNLLSTWLWETCNSATWSLSCCNGAIASNSSHKVLNSRTSDWEACQKANCLL